MTGRSKTVLLCTVLLSIAASATSAFFITRASTKASVPNTQDSAPTTQGSRVQKNRLLQPEAFRVSRQLGKRFAAVGGGVATSVGNLTFAGSQLPVTILRRQTENGEAVELAIATRDLTWSDQEGLKTAIGIPAPTEHLLAERLLLDSPDQFVLAQLRGASYFTIARNVRADDAVDGVPGPGWTQVRVQDRHDDQNPRLTSRWRIYYINSTTGLIDRIVSEWNGKAIEARILQWIEDRGEKFPAHITWLADGEVVTDYRLNSVSHSN